jgi:hypothetical protein
MGIIEVSRGHLVTTIGETGDEDDEAYLHLFDLRGMR